MHAGDTIQERWHTVVNGRSRTLAALSLTARQRPQRPKTCPETDILYYIASFTHTQSLAKFWVACGFGGWRGTCQDQVAALWWHTGWSQASAIAMLSLLSGRNDDCKVGGRVGSDFCRPRDAVHKRDLCRRAVSVPVLGCPSRSCILSKWVSISSNFFTVGWPHYSSISVPNLTTIFRPAPLTAASNAGVVWEDSAAYYSYYGTPIGTRMRSTNGAISNDLEWPWVT